MIYPMFAMVLLVFVVMAFTLWQRVKAVRSRVLRMSYFRAMQADQVPANIVISGRHLANLFEVPVLFYAVSILTIVFHISTSIMLYFAWGYVICRILHSFIHLSYNNVMHRLTAFLASNALLLAMWIYLVLNAPVLGVTN